MASKYDGCLPTTCNCVKLCVMHAPLQVYTKFKFERFFSLKDLRNLVDVDLEKTFVIQNVKNYKSC